MGKVDFVVVRILEDSVQVCGLTRGEQTKIHHSEKLNKDEVMIAQFTENSVAIKVERKALVYKIRSD